MCYFVKRDPLTWSQSFDVCLRDNGMPMCSPTDSEWVARVEGFTEGFSSHTDAIVDVNTILIMGVTTRSNIDFSRGQMKETQAFAMCCVRLPPGSSP